MSSSKIANVGQTIRITLKAFDSRLLDRSTKQLVEMGVKSGVKIIGPVPLPTKTSKYIVNRSPHKDKKSREQFGIQTHKRLMIFSNFASHLVKVFMDAQLPSGVDVEILVV